MHPSILDCPKDATGRSVPFPACWKAKGIPPSAWHLATAKSTPLFSTICILHCCTFDYTLHLHFLIINMRLFLSCLCTFFAVLAQAQLPEFSNLSSREINRSDYFHSLRVSDGILYFAPTTDNVNMLYKVGFNGTLLDSVNLSFGDYKFTGYLTPYKDGKVIFVGEANKPFLNYDQSFTDRRAVVIVLNQDLDFVSIDLYDILPYGAGRVTSTQTGSLGTVIQPTTGIGVINDTVFVAKEYYYYDTLTFNLTDIDRVLEKMVINGTAFPTVSISSTSLDVYTAVFTDESMYLYGQSSDCCGGIIVDPSAVGEYDLAGNFVEKHTLLVTSIGFDPVFESVGNRFGDRIYSSFVDEGGFFGEQCASAMLDIRDLDFTLQDRIKVPDCGMAPSGTKCVAMNGEDIYYLTKTSDYNLGLYKYDTLLNLIWGKIYDFEDPHFGLSINDTPDGGVVLECVIKTEDPSSDILKLYKISPSGDIVSSNSLVLQVGHAPVVYPNPFSSQFSVEGLPTTSATAQLYDQLGRLLYTEVFDGTPIRCPSHFLPGNYLLCLRNTGTGELLHSQWVVKGN